MIQNHLILENIKIDNDNFLIYDSNNIDKYRRIDTFFNKLLTELKSLYDYENIYENILDKLENYLKTFKKSEKINVGFLKVNDRKNKVKEEEISPLFI